MKKAEPFHLSDEQAAELINKILPDSETEEDDEKAKALLALIQLLAYGAHYDREAYSFPLMKAIYPKSHHCSGQSSDYAAEAARRMLGENAPTLDKFESLTPATEPAPLLDSPASNPVIKRVADALADLIESEQTPRRIRELVNEFTLELGNVTGAFDPDPEHVRHVVSRSLAMAAQAQDDDDQ